MSPEGRRPRRTVAVMTALAVAGAVLAALCYGAASVLQAVAVRRQGRDAPLGAGLFLRLARQGPYLAGLALDAAGFVAALVALRALPLFLVQSVVAGSVGVTAVLAWWVLGVRLRTTERIGVVALVLGLSVLAVSAQPGPGDPLSGRRAWLVTAGVLLVAVAGLLAARGTGRVQAAGLAAAAGLAFGGVAVAARGVVVPHPLTGLLTEPLFYAVLGYGALGIVLFAAALQRGAVVVATAVTFAVETVVPAVVGLAVLGDRTRPGFGGVALAGFAVTLAATVSLARLAEPEPAPGSDRATTGTHET